MNLTVLQKHEFRQTNSIQYRLDKQIVYGIDYTNK